MLITRNTTSARLAPVALSEPAWEKPAHVPLDRDGPVSQPYDPPAPGFVERSIFELFERVALGAPDVRALADGRTTLTYAEVRDEVRRLACVIEERVPAGHAVAVLLPNAPPSVIAVLACLAAGRCCIILNADHPPERNAGILSDAGAYAAVVGSQDCVEASILPDGCTPIEFSATALAGMLCTGTTSLGSDDPAIVLYTSGSTGQPKGIVLSQGTVLTRTRNNIVAMHLSPADRFLSLGALGTTAGLVASMVALLGGSQQFVMNVSATGASLLLDLIRDRQVTIVWGVPAVLRLLFEADAAAPALASLRVVRTFGDRLLSAECAAWRAALPETCHLAVTYGQTESTTAQWYVPRDFTADVAALPTGYLLPEHEYAILDDDGIAAAEGEVGELVLRSRYVALGEWEHGAVVAGRLRPDPVDPKRRILPTGDLVRLRRDGLLQIISRMDRQVKINGHRVEPAEVEDALRRVQGTAAAVTAVRREGGDAVLLAFIVAADPTDLSLPKRVRAAASKSLPTYMQPARILVIDRFPLLPGGKVDEKALLAIADATPRERQQTLHTPATTLLEAPLSSIESRVLGIMRDVLSYGDLGPDADFFEAGGDSLLAIALMLQLDSEFGTKLPARVLNLAFSARRLAATLESPLGLPSYKPLFCMPGVYATTFEYRTLALKLHTRRPILAIELLDLLTGPSALESIEGMAEATVERMREVQPVGPYALLGHSFGGNLAVEVARQLTAHDQTVELAIILDSFVPTLTSKGLSRVVRHLRIIANLKLYNAYSYISSRIQRRLFARPKSDIERRMAEAYKHCMRAFYAHHPKDFSGRIVFVGATDLDLGDCRKDADGWSSICKGGVDVIPMACRHLDFFKEPHITELAGHIDDLLNAIDKRPVEPECL